MGLQIVIETDSSGMLMASSKPDTGLFVAGKTLADLRQNAIAVLAALAEIAFDEAADKFTSAVDL